MAIGFTPSTASAGVPIIPGYFPFPPIAFGDANFCGLADGMTIDQPAIDIATTPDAGGGWFVASDGGVFNCGNAAFYGSTGAIQLNQPIVDMATTPDGKGYWLVAADGGVFAFGSATFWGSAAGTRLFAPVTSMAATPDGKGYWLAATDGGVFTFGDAGFFGSLASFTGKPFGSDGGTVIANPIVAITPSPDGRGYLLLSSPPAIHPTLPGCSGISLARREYQISGSVAAVYQSEIWQQAAFYLVMGESVDSGDTSGYPDAIQELRQLAFIPEMDVTPAQAAEEVTDVHSLDAFFSTDLAQQLLGG